MLPATLLALTSLLLTPQLGLALPSNNGPNSPGNGISVDFAARPHPDLIKHFTDASTRFAGLHISTLHTLDGAEGATSVIEDLKQSYKAPMLGDIQLGTPEQKFSVMFTVETNDFWVVSVDCDEATCKGPSSAIDVPNYTRNRFNKTASATFKEDNPPTRFTDNVYQLGTGTTGQDTFQLGTQQSAGTDGIWNITDMGVGLLTQLTPSNDTWKNSLEVFAVDGTFGLKPPSNDGQALNQLLSRMLDKSFTIWMQTPSTFNGSSQGRITFGRRDTVNCQNYLITTIPLGAGNQRWIISAPSAQFGSNASYEPPTEQNNVMTLLSLADFAPDIGAIVMPAEFYKAILKTLGVTNSSSNDSYAVENNVAFGLHVVDDCDSKDLPDLELTWSVDANTNMTFYIPKAAYALKVEGNTTQCRLAFIGLDTPLWIIGSPFYRSYCVKHDVGAKNIGFAKFIGDTSGNGVGSMAIGWANLLVPTVAFLLIALMT